jgi:hypothetical protein
MRASLWVLAFVLIMSASGIYAGVSCWWRRRQRRQGVVPRDVHPFFLRRSRLWVEQELATTAARLDVIKEAEAVMRAASDRLGPLYERPVPPSDSPVVRTAEVIVEVEHARAISEER